MNTKLSTEIVNASFLNVFQQLDLCNLNESYEIALKQENDFKNRYQSVLPYDFNRIALLGGPNGSNYINASRVEIDGGRKIGKIRHLVTQGPLENTVNDFWKMCWQEKVEIVIMLTELTDENGVEKCYQYWKDDLDRVQNYADLSVKLCSKEDNDVYVARRFQIEDCCGSSTAEQQQLKMVHFYFKAWPDKGVPKLLDFLTFYKALNVHRGTGKVSLVHCSAGIGRTGTFVLIEAMLQRLKLGKTPKPLKIVTRLRQQRMGMVETEDQLIFACNFAIHYYHQLKLCDIVH